jgi:hypothetical protein
LNAEGEGVPGSKIRSKKKDRLETGRKKRKEEKKQRKAVKTKEKPLITGGWKNGLQQRNQRFCGNANQAAHGG